LHIRDAADSLDIPFFDLAYGGIDTDIERFVTESLEDDIRFTRISIEGKALIRENLTSRAHGM
jgi:hypothetical protein